MALNFGFGRALLRILGGSTVTVRTVLGRVLVFVALLLSAAYVSEHWPSDAAAAAETPVAASNAPQPTVVPLGRYETECGNLTVTTDNRGWYAGQEVPRIAGGPTMLGLYAMPCGTVAVSDDRSAEYVPYAIPGACDAVHWFERDPADGRLILPRDVDGDGVINCNSDDELGS